ncbi:outer membrane protein, putative [Roseibacterium elongatum DSM 19469]|uniref:Outer membrane protein, putative n=1 Tax=Roseicyclus elongatus DSM 19469 TaxID=1294273 RepID=W8RVV6_9RHOB|nr:outer membrane beta-barrel protein [Roseibacterium elongatum]AHM05344.1 outer membrane protein, putative [Roseibacterium elongatum DSM 19469]
MKFAFVAGIAAASLAAVPALAGGVAEPAPEPAYVPTPAPMPVSADWTGFYAGGQLEYGQAEADGPTLDEDENGALYGLFGGYRYDFGDIVLGAELDLNAADIDIDNVGALDSVQRLGVEAGYDAGPALLYATAGAAYATIDAAGGGTLEDDGYFYGVGMDYAVTDSVTVGAELLHHTFDDFDNTGIDAAATTFGINAALRF